MASIQESIFKSMSALGISQAELSRRSGVSKSSLSRYLGGDDIPASKLGAIAHALGVTVDELMGLNRSYPLAPDERELVNLYRNMNQAQRAALMEMARSVVVGNKRDGAGNQQDVERAGIVVR